MEGLPIGQAPDRRTVLLFKRFMALGKTREIREYLGLSVAEWDDEPEVFQQWAAEFYRRLPKWKESAADD